MADSAKIDTSYQLEQNVEVLLATLTPSPLLQRGTMYQAYSQLRESRLRQKRAQHTAKTPPSKKKVSFHASTSPSGRQSSMAVAQSVPDFSAIIRKENQTPNVRAVVTPPPSTGSKNRLRGSGNSKSANGSEKKASAGSKSCASLRELKSLSTAVASAIEEEGRRKTRKMAPKKTSGQRC